MDFQPFPKIGRLSRDIIITEKLDGTNGVVGITEDGRIFAGTRNRWVAPGQDNHGFASWVYANREELLKLGPGRHFGEWWGQGIQRGYGLREKRWSLFNVTRWNAANPPPACCHIVPILIRGEFATDVVTAAMDVLKANGSYAAPGFMDPEGVVIFHTQTGHLYKRTYVGDDAGKGREPELTMAG